MNYYQLGNSTLEVSAIGFGCMSLKPADPEFSLLIREAINSGINFFDTADLYDHGKNEEALGLALKGKRDKVIIATKVGNQWKSDGSGWDWNPRKEYILSSVDESLQRLQTDYIDLYQLHGGTIDDPIDDVIETFELLKKDGKIRYYGISSIRPNVIREYVERSSITTVMMQYSLLDRRPEENCFGILEKKNISLLCRGALAQGLLAGKGPKDYLGHTKQEVAEAMRVVNECSGSFRTPAQTAIQYVLRRPQVASAITGIRTMEQLNEIANTVHTPPLTKEEIEKLESAILTKVYEHHR